MKKYRKWIIILAILAIFFIPVINEMIENSKPKGITYEQFSDLMDSKENAVVLIDKKTNPTETTLYKGLNASTSNNKLKAYLLEHENLDEKAKLELVKYDNKILESPSFVFIKDGKIIDVRSGGYSESDLNVLVLKNYYDGKDDINYKVAGNADDFFSRADEDEIVMLVLGRTSCTYCQQFKPIYNKLAAEYDIDVYYFDSDVYDAVEYQKLLNKNYIIPGKSSSLVSENGNLACTNDGKDSTISAGFSTPTTIFLKNGKSIDCVLGAVSENELASIFKYHKIAKISK